MAALPWRVDIEVVHPIRVRKLFEHDKAHTLAVQLDMVGALRHKT
jgi:hypothetical protein